MPIFHFEEIRFRQEAETLKDCDLNMNKEEAPSEGYSRFADLIGCQAF